MHMCTAASVPNFVVYQILHYNGSNLIEFSTICYAT